MTEVKVVLASVVLALAAYQLLLAGVVYGRVRLPFFSAEPAGWTHRASGHVIVVLVAVVTAHFGPTSSAELEAREERLEERREG